MNRVAFSCDSRHGSARQVRHSGIDREQVFKTAAVLFPPLAQKQRRAKDGAPVIFQEVVHSIGTGEAVCDEQAVTLETEWTTTRMPHGRL